MNDNVGGSMAIDSRSKCSYHPAHSPEIEAALRDAIDKAIAADKEPNQTYVLKLAKDVLGIRTLADQQRLLRAWHSMFDAGELCWGSSLTNPAAPFFHRPEVVA